MKHETPRKVSESRERKLERLPDLFRGLEISLNGAGNSITGNETSSWRRRVPAPEIIQPRLIEVRRWTNGLGRTLTAGRMATGAKALVFNVQFRSKMCMTPQFLTPPA